MTRLIKRVLTLVSGVVVFGLVSCTTIGPTVSLSGPPGPYIIGEPAVTLTATGSPGSSRGLWTYSFSAACGTFSPATIGPTDLGSVTTSFTPTTDVHNCVLTVTLTTAAGKKVTASITRSVGVRPTVVSTVPANSTSNVLVTSEVSVTFSHPMDPASLVLTCTGEHAGPGHGGPFGPCNMTISGPTGSGAGPYTWTVGDPNASPSTNLEYLRAYRLEVSGRRAPSFLIPMAAPHVFAFDTEPPPAAGTIIINKTAVGGDATFNYTATGTGLPPTFTITTSGGSGSQTFTGLAAGTYTVTEVLPPPPANWSFTSLSCTAGGVVGPANTATITLITGTETVTCTYTNTYVIPSLPACTQAELADGGVPSGGVDNHPISGAAGARAFAYVQLYDAISPYYDDTVLHLRSSILTSPSQCPATGDLECDDDDGSTYSSLGGTFIAYDFNSVIAGHPLGSASDYVAVNGFLGDPVDPYRLYRHVVPAANLVVYPTDPPAALPGVDVPATPTPWMIGQSISPSADVDWYRFKVDTAPIGLFVALDTSPDTPTSPHDDVSSWYGVIELRDGTTGALLKSTSTRTYIGPGPFGDALAIRITSPGTYIIAVRWYGTGPTPAGYHLTACTTPTVLPAGAEGPTEQKQPEEKEGKER